jgi:predicted ATPase
MLTNLTLENFKAFQKLDDLKIKPITILCGTNSCGKSSILQSILLLKQTLESQNPNQNLLLNGRFVKLGHFQDVIYSKNIERPISLKFNFFFDRNSDLPHYLDKVSRDGFFNLNEYLEGDDCNIQFNVDLQLQNKELKETPDSVIHPIIKEISIRIIKENAEGSISSTTLSVKDLLEKEYSLDWYKKKIGYSYSKKIQQVSFANLFPKSFSQRLLANPGYPEELPMVMYNLLNGFKELFKDMFSYSYSYIGPLRGEPQRRYIYEDEVVEIGNKGENAAYLYLNEQNKRINNHYFFSKLSDNFEEIPNQTLHSALQRWFDLMKIPNFEAEITNKIIYLNMEASAYDETRVGIADVGFGVSQIFPIILEGLRMEKGATLMLEQPEIHLHPNLQMQMADYFISLALSGKQVLVETHSDHVINRLVRRIVEDETHNLQDLIGIYFIKPSENGSVYEEVRIDETKGIVNWPPDFFDQTANEQMKIMQAGLKKRKNQRIPANGNAS